MYQNIHFFAFISELIIFFFKSLSKIIFSAGLVISINHSDTNSCLEKLSSNPYKYSFSLLYMGNYLSNLL